MNLTDRLSPNHGERLGEGGQAPVVDMLVLHYTGMVPQERALAWLCDPVSQVSAHYGIDTDGTVCRLVDEERRAWHAGVSCWRGAHDINSRSIGIELANPGHDYGYCDFPAVQIQALVELCTGIVSRHPIPPRNVVGHSDIAPARKTDPGERFPWPVLADAGIGLCPGDTGPVGDTPLEIMLADYGYDLDGNARRDVIAAFQRHFRPEKFDGADDAQTRRRIAALLALVAETPPIA